MDRNQQALKWLEKEKQKDNLEISYSKQKLIDEIQSFNKNTLFAKPQEEKVTIWKRIRKIIWGN
jgi:hypothetical protein